MYAVFESLLDSGKPTVGLERCIGSSGLKVFVHLQQEDSGPALNCSGKQLFIQSKLSICITLCALQM